MVAGRQRYLPSCDYKPTSQRKVPLSLPKKFKVLYSIAIHSSREEQVKRSSLRDHYSPGKEYTRSILCPIVKPYEHVLQWQHSSHGRHHLQRQERHSCCR